MMITVADRFNFSSTELFSMKTSRLKFWYNAVRQLHEQEKESIEKVKNG